MEIESNYFSEEIFVPSQKKQFCLNFWRNVTEPTKVASVTGTSQTSCASFSNKHV